MEENKYYSYEKGTNNMRKSKFWTFVLSFFPGVGHMYLGLMKQGVQLMSLFFGIIAIASLLNMEFFCFLLPIIWFYGIFDATEKCNNQYINKNENLELINWIYKGNINYKIDRKLVGYIFMILAGIILLNNIIIPIISTMFGGQYWFITSMINNMVLVIIFIWGGYTLIKKNPDRVKIKVEDIREFKEVQPIDLNKCEQVITEDTIVEKSEVDENKKNE